MSDEIGHMPTEAERPLSTERSLSVASGEVAAGQAKKPPSRLRRLRRVLLLAGPLLVIIVGGYFYFTGGRYVGTENAYVKADTVMISAEVNGLITQVAVKENQHVAAGDLLFRIDDSSYRIALAEADAQVANVRDDIARLKASYSQLEEELALAQTNIAFAKRKLDRHSKLLATNAISRTMFDDVEHDYEVAQRQIRVVQQEMAQVRAQLAGDPDIPVEQHPRFLEAKASRDQAALDLAKTAVRAPFAGVASNTPQIGQRVVGDSPMASPVMSLVADSGVWIDANFKETELTHVEPGQPVSITVDTYPDREWHGVVASISQATGAEFSVIPPQNATGNWVKVVQRIPVRIAVDTADKTTDQDKSGGNGPTLRAGMSTSVEIDTGHRRPMPEFVRTVMSWFPEPLTANAAESDGAR